jgi:cell division protein FtsN
MAGSKRRKVSGQRGASRGQQRTPAWMWLLSGILIGLGLAYYLWAKGYIPTPASELPQASDTGHQSSEPGIADDLAKPEAKPEKPRYDFFTVLPEMEVVVPEQQLKESSQPQAQTPLTDTESYFLQVGSFKQAGEAEQTKATLALLGMTAKIQTVNVNGSTWHRVRIGPITGARQTDEIRQRLSDNGIDSLVMKNP